MKTALKYKRCLGRFDNVFLSSLKYTLFFKTVTMYYIDRESEIYTYLINIKELTTFKCTFKLTNIDIENLINT